MPFSAILVSMVFGKDKIIGTFAPVFSLRSSVQEKDDYGTFESGIIFLDWLHQTRQHAWQMLPLNETQIEKGSKTKHVPSPYKGYGIGLDPKFLSAAYKKTNPSPYQLDEFIAKHDFWIKDYALFCALRDAFGTDDWREWETDIKMCNENAIKEWEEKLQKEIAFYITQQWQLHESYQQLHQKANELDVLLIGDVPFYLSLNSPLVWRHKSFFEINDRGEMTHVSGAVTKKFSHFGRQVWGHPLYTYKDIQATITFWKKRIEYTSFLFDIIRFDYAAGFFEYAAKDPRDPKNDEERTGPGESFFGSLIDYAHEKEIRVFAEDSGKHVQQLREYMASRTIPGIRIFRYAYDELRDCINPYYANISEYPARSIIYSTTHDTETIVSYLHLLDAKQRNALCHYMQISDKHSINDMAERLRSKVIHSSANTIIIPIQDWLLSENRINVPGTEKEIDDKNWQYMIETPIEDLPRNIFE